MANEKVYIYNDDNIRINVYEEAQTELQLINENPSIEIVKIYEPGPQGPKGNDGGEFILPENVVSSSAQIASDISGSFISASSVLSGRILFFENKTLFSSSQQANFAQLANIPANLVSGSDQISSSYDSKYELKGRNVVSSSEQIASNISGSFVSASNSLSNRIGVFEGKTLFSASQQINFQDISGSFSTSSFLQNSFTASFNSFSSSAETRIFRLESVTSSFVTNSSTSSLLNNSYSASNDLRVGRLEAVTSSFAVKTEVSGAFTSTSASLSNRIGVFEGKTLFSGSSQVVYSQISSIPSNIVSGSEQLTSNYDLRYHRLGTGLISSSAQISSDVSGSSVYILNNFNAFTSSIVPRIGSLEATTGSLNTFSGSTNNRLNRLELTSGSVNLFTSSIQLQVDSLKLTSGSLNTFTASIQSEVNALKITSGSVNSRLQSIELISASYATTGSNTFKSNQIISGSVSITGSLNVIGQVSGTFIGNGTGLIGIISASYALTASYVSGSSQSSISSSYAATSSYASVAQTLLGSVVSASYALTASYALNGGGGTNVQTIGIRIKTEDTYITEGSKGFRHIGYNSNITKLRSIANIAGTINLNVNRNGTLLGNYNLTNASSSIDTTLTGWSTSLNANDLIEFSVSQSSIYITDLTFFMDLQSI